VSFIFGGETGLTYEEVQQQRERARELARLLGGTPQNVGEGLNYLGMAIASRMAQNRANRGEATIRQRGNDAFSAITSALTGSGSAGGTTTSPAPSGNVEQPNPGFNFTSDMGVQDDVPLSFNMPQGEGQGVSPSDFMMPREFEPLPIQGALDGVDPNLVDMTSRAWGYVLPDASIDVSTGVSSHSPVNHAPGHAIDFRVTRPDGTVVNWNDPETLQAARIGRALGVLGIGAGQEYMGGNHFHWDVSRNGARTWSDSGANQSPIGFGQAEYASQIGAATGRSVEDVLDELGIDLGDPQELAFGSTAERDFLSPQVAALSQPEQPGMSVTASARAPTGGIAGQVRQGLVDRFTSQLGIDPQRAEMFADAFLMNMEDESGLVPDMIERVPNVHGTRGRGLYQLTGDRREAYERIYGDDYGVDNQLDFLISELQGPESRAWNSIAGAGTAGEAAAAIVTNFLRPAAQHRDRRVAEYLGGRMPNLETTASASDPADAPSSDIGAATLAALGATSPAPQPRQGGAPMQPRQQNPIVQALMNMQPNNVLMGDVGSMPGGPQSPVVLDREGNAMANPMRRPDAQRGMAAGGVTGAVQQAAQGGGGIGSVIQSLLGGGQQQPRQPSPVAQAIGQPAPAQPPVAPIPAPVAPPQAGAAPASAPQPGQPDLANIPLSALTEAAGNPMLTDAQRGVAATLLEQRLQQPDPMDAIELERAQLELERLRNPQEDQTSLMQNYNFLIEQGFTPEQALDRLNAGPTIHNNITGDAPPAVDATLRDELQKNRADVLTGFTEAAAAAASVRNDLQALRELSAFAPSGPLEGRFAQMFPEFNDVAAARNAIVRRVAPTLRAEGSGSTSDIEYAGMVAGLGELPNSPEVNVAIADMMLAKSDLDLRRGAIVSQYEAGSLPYEDMVNQLEELNQVSIMPDSLRAILDGASGAGAIAPSDFTSMTPQDLIAVDTSGFTTEQWEAYDAALAAAMEAAQ
jgi:hypothetical protein